jgi:hypothetical protein
VKIDKKLNLVMPVEAGEIHSTPISYAVFEKYFLPISRAFARVYGEGLGTLAGPRVAYLMLKQVAMEDNMWEGSEGVENGLMNEIYRLSNLVRPSKTQPGWECYPLYEAMHQGLLDDEERAEVNNALVFFTLVSSMHKKTELPVVLRTMTKFWGGQTTSLDSTAYAASLLISTQKESTGEKADPKVKASSIPS